MIIFLSFQISTDDSCFFLYIKNLLLDTKEPGIFGDEHLCLCMGFGCSGHIGQRAKVSLATQGGASHTWHEAQRAEEQLGKWVVGWLMTGMFSVYSFWLMAFFGILTFFYYVFWLFLQPLSRFLSIFWFSEVCFGCLWIVAVLMQVGGLSSRFRFCEEADDQFLDQPARVMAKKARVNMWSS